MIGNKLLIEHNLFLLIKLALKIAIFCQINYFKNILYIKFNFESIGDNFEVTGLLFIEILAKNQQILMKTAFIF